ncbi:(3R)-3-hydroxyacyl-CoA dehydrogenase-like [Portunus trituberculatus]|uniref:(3R)-3-hydroxyacyl-CoA dehydrogenase-like n=1 Tax=Portunus trituberculatus TaxID=210409 RepID=UPI001E1D00B5|nr:(3R)-3-hydroxyacyl-CoA dehydrogenase-like [Portunus trituberculatus]
MALKGLHHLCTHSVRASPEDATMAPNDFTGQVALVTGGGSGIGRATCLLLARDGARVVVTDFNVQTARETHSLMPNPEKHLALQMDVTQQSAVQSVIATVRDKYGEPPSLLVNAAGIMNIDPSFDKTGDVVINVNLKGIFIVTEAFTEELLKGNEGAQEDKGVIVNIASILGKLGHPDFRHYAASKGGVITYSKSCAAHMIRKGIRINCILPGLVDTAMTKPFTEEFRQSICDKTPLPRAGKPEEIAEVVVFLLSWRSSFMVGACVEVTGGDGM